MSGRRILAACAGPALIVAGVAFALQGFVVHDRLTQAHPDILTFWLPRFSFLGRSIADGHIPLWNPFEMAGSRFAADPQGGWLYLTPMVLFSALSPAAAMRAFIVVNPLIAGLGLYGFARLERLSRVAATVGGLSLAMLMSTSEIAVSMPFAGSLAWTTVTLMGAAGYRRTDRWSRRIAWLALGGLGWSQVATAHLSHGLVMCSLLVVAYLVSGAVKDVRGGRSRAWTSVGRAALFMVMLPLASLAVLLPRVDALRGSSLAAGYDRLGDALGSLGGADAASIQANGVWAAWPVAFGAAPGAYAGAVVLLAVPLALRARRHRALVWGIGGALVLSWVAMLDVVVTAPWFRSLLLRIPFGDVYLHNPGRMRYLAVIAIPLLGAIGIQGLREDPMAARRAAVWIGASALVWLGVPLAAGAEPVRFALLAVALIAAGTAVWLLATARTWVWVAVIAVLSLELVAGATWSHSVSSTDTILLGLEGGEHPNLIPQPLPAPDVDAAAFVAPTAFVPRLRDSRERYLTWAPPAAAFEKGYLFMQSPPDWPALAMERGTLFGIRDPLGYNPLQLPRYWAYVRARTDLPVFYNASVIDRPTREDVALLGVRYLVVPTGVASPLPGRRIDRAQGYDLIELGDWQAQVSVVPRWSVVGSSAEALAAALTPGFDPASEALVETDPGLGPPQIGEVHGEADVTVRSPEELDLQVRAGAPSIVLVRAAYDEGWTATVDGAPTAVVPVDGFLQGVPVTAGQHTVTLTYRDPAIMAGLATGSVVWLVIGGSFLGALFRERRRRPTARTEPAHETPGGGGP